MSEGIKFLIVVALLMMVAGIAFVLDYFLRRIGFWLTLIVVSVFVLMMALTIHPLRAHAIGVSVRCFMPGTMS